MTRGAGIFMCLLIVTMDIAAGILGIQAQIAQKQGKHLRVWIFECKEPSHNAFLLGLIAAILLALAHIIANLVGSLTCLRSQPEGHGTAPNTNFSKACLILTWLVFAVGMGMLVMGTKLNHKSSGSCGFTYHYLSVGGILCFVHGLVYVVYYISATP